MSEEIERLKRENAELREQIHWLKKGDVLHVLTDQELADQQKHEREMRASIDALEDENAKLRKLYAYFLRQMKLAGCFDCFSGNCEEWDKCHGECVLERRARELRIEVPHD